MYTTSLTSVYYRTFVIVLLANICLPTTTLACGPGRGGIRRRGARKLTPLVYKQHEPNFSERSLAASGMPEGFIDRTSEKFRHLVPNYSPDIIFKDEEGTGADRLMTQRCKEKLNNLATTVMNQWSGVRLRVTEAWDEDRHHAEQSLHYEGRAVDLTTSDRDRTKYGLLARLAVEAGFDWVYYESRAHIHASCKSESYHQSKNGGCFPGTSKVITSDGKTKSISDLEVGEEILTSNSDGSLTFSPVILFLDKDANERRQYFVVETENGEKLTLTPTHLLYAHIVGENTVNDIDVDTNFDTFESVYASYVREGDYVLVLSRGQLKPSKIVSIETKILEGVYAPLTLTGNLVVDGTLASCYAVISSQVIAHTAFAPLRWTHTIEQIFSSQQSSQSVPPGVHWYADFLYTMAKYILPKSMLR